ITGEFAGEKLFVSLMKNLVLKKDKLDRGVALTGMRYCPDTIEFSQIVHILSKPAYQAIQQSLSCLPASPRTLEQRRAREIQFPIGITPRTFELIVERIRQLKYSGPLGLACDDTKLHPALRPHWDQE
ncbi:hypothetical protein FA95DRAFT_1462946, partial [Auriscalpium vulgare]